MSMNLLFKVKNVSNAYIDFPFQTPTELTFKVLQAKSVETRLDLLEKAMFHWGWSKIETINKLEEIKNLLNSSFLELIFT